MVSPTRRAALAAVREKLRAAGCPDAGFDALELVRFVTGADPRLDGERPLTGEQAQRLDALAERRAGREPLQYLLGSWPFLDFELKVGPGVLCPRADTEIVCEEAAALLRGCTAPRVLDLCSGSGCLALGIKRLVPAAQVTAVEKSEAAFLYCKYNCENTLQNGKAAAVQADVFAYQNELRPGALDLIVANPPYLTAAEMADLQPEVAQEPALALDGGEDGLRFYRHLAAAYAPALADGGWMVWEIGWKQAEACTALLRQAGWRQITVKKDLNGNDRVVLARKGAESPGDGTAK